MILYHSPQSCSTASLLALAESGLPYAVRTVDARSGETRQLPYRAINRWGRVPALVLDSGEVVTETVAILALIAQRVPDRALLPEIGTARWAQALAVLALLSGTVHIAFRPLLRPDKLAATEAGRADVVREGAAALNAVLAEFERTIAGDESVLEEGFSLCDAYAFVFAQWTRRPQVAPHVTATPRLDAVARAVAARPATVAALGALATA